MKFIKTFVTVLCIIVLFLGLFINALGLIVHSVINDYDFIISTLNSIDITPFIEKALSEEFGTEIPKEVQKDFADKMHLLVRSELEKVIRPLYNYLLGKSESFDAEISLVRLKTELKPLLLDYLLKSQPDAARDRIKKEYEIFWNDISSGFSDTINLKQLLEQNNAVDDLRAARDGIAVFERSIMILSVIIVFCAVLIILMQKQPHRFLLIFGIVFICSGAILFAAGLITNVFKDLDLLVLQIPDTAAVPVFGLLKILFEKILTAGTIMAAFGVASTVTAVILRTRTKPGPDQDILQD